MPEVLRDLGRASRWVNVAAARGGGRLFDFSLGAARDQAWSFAERTYPLSSEGRAREAAALDGLVRTLAYVITKPGRPIRWLVPVGRWLETDDPRRVTRELLGPLA